MARYDVLIRGGRVVDGTGSPWYYGDVAIGDDRIVAVEPRGVLRRTDARTVVDASGMVVCPGFIDIQSHSVLPLMVDGRSVSKVTQGITTEIMGESWTPAPAGGKIADPLERSFFTLPVPGWEERVRSWSKFGAWLDAMVDAGVSPNIGSFLGAGTMRQFAMGLSMARPTRSELLVMKRVVAQAMEDGAFGVSYALIYAPDGYAATDEIIEICRIVARYHGCYITHMRSEADDLESALEEAIAVGREAGAPVEIYHLKAAGSRNWHKMPAVIERIHLARAEGIDITCSMYPYTGSSTSLAAALPPWAQADGRFFENLADSEMRAQIRQELLRPSGGWEAMIDQCGPGQVLPVGMQKEESRRYVGMRLSEIATARGQRWPDTVMDLCLSERSWISTIYFMMSEDNVRLQLQQPWIKIATDAGGFDPAWAQPMGPCHPRAYGACPRVLGRYVRAQHVLTLEDAIHKMSGAVATRLGLSDRGLLRVGCMADVVVFDADEITDNATFEEPHQLSGGVHDVWINGVRVVRRGQHTGAKPGRVVRGRGSAKQPLKTSTSGNQINQQCGR